MKSNHLLVLYEFELALSFLPGPHFAAVNNNNEIIITDFHNHSVKVNLGITFYNNVEGHYKYFHGVT